MKSDSEVISRLTSFDSMSSFVLSLSQFSSVSEMTKIEKEEEVKG